MPRRPASQDRSHSENRPRRRFRRYRAVAFICLSESAGGLELTTIRLASECRTRGAQPLIIAPAGSPLEQLAASEGMPFGALRPRLKYGDLLAAGRLAVLMRRHRTEIAILMRSQDIHLAALARLSRRAPHLVFYQQMQSGLAKRDPLHSWVHARIDRWLTLTARMRDDVLRLTRIPPERVDVVPLGRDTTVFRPDVMSRGAARQSLHLPDRRLVVGMLGRLDRQKGQDDFLQAASRVITQHRRAIFLIMGDETRNEPGERNRLEGMIRDLGLAGAVRMLPGTEDVRPFLASLDLFVMPSHAETYGLVLIEAMAMGLPVIATNAGGVPEIVRDGIDGLLVPPRDPDALAAAILRFAGDSRLRKRFGLSARARACDAFDAAPCADRLVGSLDSLPQYRVRPPAGTFRPGR